MLYQKPLFSDKYLQNKFQSLDVHEIENLTNKLELVGRWKKSLNNQTILKSKEESLQGMFLQQFFADILGFSNHKDSGVWFLETEQKTSLDSTKMDGALGFFKIEDKTIHADVRVVIELKDAQTDLDKPQHRNNDKRTPIQQAFDYANAVGGECRWVIVSNFKEIRLYFQTDRTRYQHFNLLTLDKEEQFKRFYFLLNKNSLIAETGDSATDKLYFDRQAEELAISKSFYLDYKQARFDFFYSLKKHNPEIEALVLLNKTQKLLDRLVFIHFCEDYNIIDAFTLKKLIDNARNDLYLQAKDKIYQRLTFLFSAINKGNPPLNINKFNGGLFAEDEVFNGLLIDDSMLDPVLKLVEYDLASDLGVNILGHIFEQSISDIELLKAEITGEVFNQKQGKRKKEGVFYTPDYITRYIVEEAIGGWLTERRNELNESELPKLVEGDFKSIKIVSRGKNKGKFSCNANIQLHIDFYEAYKVVLSAIKVLDPACGSGAFLNQAFDFLHQEGERVNKELARLLYPVGSAQLTILELNAQLDKHILRHNLFGVDLNQESVEITKLSLWIKTANRYKALTSLDDNIRCGNSLIDDVEIAGDKAFVWEKEFKEIMESGGFDVIIGNPPYGAFFRAEEKNYLSNKFQCFKENLDSYSAFLEFAFTYANKNSYCGYIIPVSWQTSNNFLSIRKYIKENNIISKAIKLPYNTFSDAYIDTGVYIIKNSQSSSYESLVYEFPVKQIINTNLEIDKFLVLPNEYWENENDLKIVLNPFYYTASSKIKENSVTLNEISNSIRGILANSSEIHENYSKELKKYFIGDIGRYFINERFKWVLYGDNLKEHPKKYAYFCEERLLIRRIINRKFRMMTFYVNNEFVNKKDIYNLKITNKNFDIKYILVLLNSKLISFIKTSGATTATKDDFSQLTLADIRSIPIKNIKDIEQTPFIEKADIMLEQNKNLQQQTGSFLNFIQAELNPQKISTKLKKYYQLTWDEFKAELKKSKVDLNKLNLDEREQWLQKFESEKQKAVNIKNIIDQTDNEIDDMVYKLYGLNTDDIAIINSK